MMFRRILHRQPLMTSRIQRYHLFPAQRQSQIQLAVFDVGGTIAIPYCYIPEEAFDRAFRFRGIIISRADIRRPMGLNKIKHLDLLFNLETVQQQWQQLYGTQPTESDVSSTYQAFLKIQNHLLCEEASAIPYASEALNFLRNNKVKIAFTSGFNIQTTTLLVEKLKHQLGTPDTITAADQVPDGSRRAMILKSAQECGISQSNLKQVVFFTDSINDIKDVKNKMNIWTIGVSDFSTHVGIGSQQEAMDLSENELLKRRSLATAMLREQAPHEVLSSLNQIAPLLAELNRALEEDCTPETVSDLRSLIIARESCASHLSRSRS